MTGRTRPYTGAEYLESIRDGREIYIYGERVKDVTTHPAFRNTARMIARLYDALHDPATQPILTMPTDTGSGGFTHRFYRPSRNAEEMVAAREAIAPWARGEDGFPGGAAAERRGSDGREGFSGRAGGRGRSARVAQSVLGADRCDGAQRDAVDGGIRAAESRRGA